MGSTVYCAGPLPSDEDRDLETAASIETHGDEHALVLRASRLAHAVRIEAPGWMPDDNYFHLEPDEEHRVALRPLAAGADLRVRVSALNASRSVTVAAEAIHAG
jgi:beta-mannosidase